MEIKILSKEEQDAIYAQAYEMLENADNEFVPPLSSRTSSTQKDFLKKEKGDGIKTYFEQLKTQRFLSVCEENTLIGFASFKENYTCNEVKELPNIYVSTIVVSPLSRGKGVTSKIYDALFKKYNTIFTRTWSTNYAHIKILERLSFKPVKTLPNDRGNGIDTIYFKGTLNGSSL